MNSVTAYLQSISGKILDDVMKGIAAELGISESKLWIESLVDDQPAVFYVAKNGDTLSACAIGSRYFREAVALNMARDAICSAKLSARFLWSDRPHFNRQDAH